jgi:hypothetical protein
MSTTIENLGNSPVIRTYFYFSHYELALVTMADLNNDVVTYTSTGAIEGVECKLVTSLFETFGRVSIQTTQDEMMAQHTKVLLSEKFMSFIEGLQNSDKETHH